MHLVTEANTSNEKTIRCRGRTVQKLHFLRRARLPWRSTTKIHFQIHCSVQFNIIQIIGKRKKMKPATSKGFRVFY